MCLARDWLPDTRVGLAWYRVGALGVPVLGWCPLSARLVPMSNICAKMYPEPDRRNCTAPRTSPYAGQRHVRFGRRAGAHLGRFLPRLGPFASPSGPFFVARLRSPETSAAVTYSHSYAQPNFCNAKRFACILCAANLHTQREAGDPVAGFVALLGRFLPRLGPHGLPRGPFYLLMPASSRDSGPEGL